MLCILIRSTFAGASNEYHKIGFYGEIRKICIWIPLLFRDMGPVVHSVVSLTSSLRVISLTGLADSIYNILIFFQQKISAYLRITRCKF